MKFDSAYWMNRVADTASALSQSREWFAEGRVTAEMVAADKKRYDQAFQMYTNPHNVKKGI